MDDLFSANMDFIQQFYGDLTACNTGVRPKTMAALMVLGVVEIGNSGITRFHRGSTVPQ